MSNNTNNSVELMENHLAERQSQQIDKHIGKQSQLPLKVQRLWLKLSVNLKPVDLIVVNEYKDH